MQSGYREPLENPVEPYYQKPFAYDGGSGGATEFTAAPLSIPYHRRNENLGMNVVA
jgi:hypothetical protein